MRLVRVEVSARRRAWERAYDAVSGDGERRARIMGTLLVRKERWRKSVEAGLFRRMALERVSRTAVTKSARSVLVSF